MKPRKKATEIIEEEQKRLYTTTKVHIDALRRDIERMEELPLHLNKVVAGYMRDGVAVFGNGTVDRLKTYGVALRGHIRDLASALGRPYITAEHAKWSVYRNNAGYTDYEVTTLQVPNNTKCSNLVAGLVLASKELAERNAGGYNAAIALAPLCYLEGKGHWVFYFIGPEGKQAFNAWLEQCRSDPVFKTVLRTHA